MSSGCYTSFYLTIDYAGGVNGCYEDTTTSVNDLDAYFLDGLETEGSSVVYATSTFRDDHVIWVVGNVYDIDVEEGIWDVSPTCKDAAEEDATTLHPVEVNQWDCYSIEDDDYTRLDEVQITCSCGTIAGSTPSPVREAGSTLSPLEEGATRSPVQEAGSTLSPVSPPIATPSPTPSPTEPTPRTPVPITPTLAPASPPTTTPSPTDAPAEPTTPLTPAPVALSLPAPASPPTTTPPPTSGSRAIEITSGPITLSTSTMTPSPTPGDQANAFTAAPLVLYAPEPVFSPTATPFPTPALTGSTFPFTPSPLPDGTTTPATVASSGGGDTSTVVVVAGAVGGGLVVGVIATVILLFKTGRLKHCRHGSSDGPSPGVGPIPAAAPSAMDSARQGMQIPAAMQYPEALRA
ncbi:unnamed protein product [Ectocarpus fasciculatus]